MNKSQRKFLMDEMNKIYQTKLSEINLKYEYLSPDNYYSIKKYIKDNNLENKLKLKIKNKNEFVNNFLNTLESLNMNDQNEFWIFRNTIETYVTSFNTYFDLENIKSEMIKKNNIKDEKLDMLKDKYDQICDTIMFGCKISKYLKDINSEGNMDEDISKYIEELEKFEV